jgi:phage anti-repressor protein
MQTVLQELISELKSIESYDSIVHGIIKRAESKLEKEKEQIIDAFDYGYYCASNGTSAEITLDGKMNYNQTYNQQEDKTFKQKSKWTEVDNITKRLK